ncbi:bile acid:sodium symporter [Stackebrandtia nassauensis]|nr:bile acid:sodium symporter [Stackebrandtia nassauensis]
MERRQVGVYLGALVVGGLMGWMLPSVGAGLGLAVNPVLGALLLVTFLQVPVGRLVGSLRDGRFVAAVLVVNFVAVPLVVAVLWVLLPADEAVRVGVLLVLLTPCVDYVIVFSGLAGGSSRRLLAVTPLLLIVQMVLLPVFLWLFMGAGFADVVALGPFVEAFVVLIVVPLVVAWVGQGWAARWATGARVLRAAGMSMVPLMAVTLAMVVASQVPELDGELGAVGGVVPFYVVFFVVMVFVGRAVGRVFGLGVAAGRAVVFSGVTRNSLVVLPLALALPGELAAAAVVVVAQTMVEVCGMVVLVRYYRAPVGQFALGRGSDAGQRDSGRQ